jgi:hypothetical protein
LQGSAKYFLIPAKVFYKVAEEAYDRVSLRGDTNES